MNHLDISTAIFSIAMICSVCALFIIILWIQHRKKFSGIGYWAAGLILFVSALLLIAVRESVHPFLSVTLGNLLMVSAALALLIGLENYLEKPGSKISHGFLLIGFGLSHAYFTFVHDSILIRIVLFSLAMAYICIMGAWLLLFQVKNEDRSTYRITGIAAIVMAGIFIYRILLNVSSPVEGTLFKSNSYDAMLALVGQILFLILAFSLILNVNRRLQRELENDIHEKIAADAEIQQKNKLFAALQETTLELLSQLDFDVLLENIVKRAGALTGTTAGYLDLVDPETGELKPRVGLGALAESLEHSVNYGEGVAGTVWETGKPLIIENYDQWETRIENFSTNSIRSIVGVPLLSGEQVLGVLGLAYDADSPQCFTQQDVELLTQFSQLVVIGINNAQLYSNAQQELFSRKQAEAIIRLQLKLWESAGTLSLNQLLQMALDEIERLTHSAIGFYHFVKDDQKTIALQVWSTQTLAEFCEAEGDGLHYPIDQAGVWVDCVRQMRPIIHNDYRNLPHRKGLPEGHAEVIRELVVPTIRNGKVVAILGVGNKSLDYDDADAEFVHYIADAVWEIVEKKLADDHILELNDRLEVLAMTDDLTKLPNRRAFFKRSEHEFNQAKRDNRQLSILMIDIDEFKKINDTFGHDAGDKMLQCVANTMKDSIRESDYLARLGGEEFGILLPNTQSENAFNLAKRIRISVENLACPVQQYPMNVTISIGGSSFHQDMNQLRELIKQADLALYEAKDNGRNNVVFAPSQNHG